MKPYYEQAYKHSQKVLVKIEGIEAFEDEIKGLNAGHALYLARLNWSNAQIELI